ncbi:DEAD/DEAH box helicase domain protein [Nitzschia inconspicua]|uniref:DEAD/DEAH box helicase domain protein n=1 Tax=Nitzschia inconspicua TaxID=303405 RepID=A0A9K3L4P1_9STRA|nr:DEAD/DEAH box helicase domain protein [Nitzschia inconspicua]
MSFPPPRTDSDGDDHPSSLFPTTTIGDSVGTNFVSNNEDKKKTCCDNNSNSNKVVVAVESLVASLSLLDPLLQFLTRATGQTAVPLERLHQTIPIQLSQKIPWHHFEALVQHGIIHVRAKRNDGTKKKPNNIIIIDNNNNNNNNRRVNDTDDTDTDTTNISLWRNELKVQWNQEDKHSSGSFPDKSWEFFIGFPPTGQQQQEQDINEDNRKLCGSTKAAAKRRLAALKKRFKKDGQKHPQQQQQHCKTNHLETPPSDITMLMRSERNYDNEENNDIRVVTPAAAPMAASKDWSVATNTIRHQSDEKTAKKIEEQQQQEEEGTTDMKRQAMKAIQDLLGLTVCNDDDVGGGGGGGGGVGGECNSRDDSSSAANTRSTLLDTIVPSTILPKQLSYAGSQPAQNAEFDDKFTGSWNDVSLHPSLKDAFLGKDHNIIPRRRLYNHQAMAISSALNDQHTLVCTGTGSGKSLCFWIPIFQRAMEFQQKSIVIFPTKALAQDQLVKLQTILEKNPTLTDQFNIRAATLDGDTPHGQRSLIAETCSIILTNPDTLHASILPNWKSLYKDLLKDLKYVVVDEAHMYQGVFGAHVAMILARLYRLHCCCCCRQSKTRQRHTEDSERSTASSSSSSSKLVFLSCSATLAHPEHHFRLLCCIPSTEPVTVLTKDSSPKAAKHFFVWNPPLLDTDGKSLGYVEWPKRKNKSQRIEQKKQHRHKGCHQQDQVPHCSIQDRHAQLAQHEQEQHGTCDVVEIAQDFLEENEKSLRIRNEIRRRHSADETALLLARAVMKGVRCIAFCKTRCLVEWVYERCISTLKQCPDSKDLISKVDSYRGGYTKMKRREIEEKLFNNQLLGVVGTSALELGVDIGGVEMTLHCGFPSDHASLMQQAGRAGRGVTVRPSLVICVCFNSPVDQHLWRHPSSLLQRGLSAPLCMPIYPGLVQGHLLCAGQEFPLTGKVNVTAIQSVESPPDPALLPDEALFGSHDVFSEALEVCLTQGKLSRETLPIWGDSGCVSVYKTHPSINNPWKQVSIRSIECVNYDIVDLSHPLQANRTDGGHNEAAILDNIPYSRVFYHAFPGAIITHRGRRYKIVSMTRPPAFGAMCGRTMTLGAYAKPSTQRYFTRPLSNMHITVVKQMERIEILGGSKETEPTEGSCPIPFSSSGDGLDVSEGSFAGCGVLTLKRTVHGYKKLSLVTREELSRLELALPDMEFDTFGFWLDCDAGGIGRAMTPQDFGYGVHALSHAICNVAPLFVPCVMNDVQCDHSFYSPTRIAIFDSRAGGSGICAELWKFVFRPRGVLHAALELLEHCPSCSEDRGYVGGCPACIQAGECIKFNDFLCKRSALTIGRHLLKRMEQTELYQANMMKKERDDADDNGREGKHGERRKRSGGSDCLAGSLSSSSSSSPRRKRRQRQLRAAKDHLEGAQRRQTVVGRPSWPMDPSGDGPSRYEQQEA